jgi:hypothetical protein
LNDANSPVKQGRKAVYPNAAAAESPAPAKGRARTKMSSTWSAFTPTRNHRSGNTDSPKR